MIPLLVIVGMMLGFPCRRCGYLDKVQKGCEVGLICRKGKPNEVESGQKCAQGREKAA